MGDITKEELQKEPIFAVICSFFNKFGSVLGIKPQSFSKLESILTFDEDGRVDKELIDLHIKLLRKAGAKGVTPAKWENAIFKYCAMDPVLRVECFTLERFGYAHAPLHTKLNILKTLCDRQFDWNFKFKEQVSGCSSSELRLLPVGVDKVGQAYWYQLDADLNLRIYSEEPDDSSGATWTLQAQGREELNALIEKLQTGETQKQNGIGSAEASADESDSEEKNGVKREASKKDEPSQEKPLGVKAEPGVAKDVKTEAFESVPSQSQTIDTKPPTPDQSDAAEEKTSALDEVGQSEIKTELPVEKLNTQPISSKEETTGDKPSKSDTHEVLNSETTANEKVEEMAVENAESKLEGTSAPNNQDNVAEEVATSSKPADETIESQRYSKPSTDAMADQSEETIIAEKIVETETKKEEVAAEKPKQMKVRNKKGTFMDTYQLEPSIRGRRGRGRGQGGGGRSGSRGRGAVEKLKEEEDNNSSTSPIEDNQDSQDIPDELKPFIERRIQPRRSTRNALKRKEEEENEKVKPEESMKKGKGKKMEKNKESSGEEEEMSEEQESLDGGSSDSSEYMPLSLLRESPGKGKRRRRRREVESEDSEEGEEETVKKERKQANDNSFCKRCGKSSNPQVLLLCDKCDDAWHTWCLKPALWYVPDEDWFCPKCQHNMLIDKLTTALTNLDEQLKKKQEENKAKARQQDRLKREMQFIGISLNNIIKPQNGEKEEGETSSEDENEHEKEDSEDERRRRKKKRKFQPEPAVPIALSRTKRETRRVDYTFSGFDELVQEAVEDLQECPSKPKYTDPARPAGGAGRGKDMANIIEANKEQEKERTEKAGVAEEKGEDGEEGDTERRVGKPVVPAAPKNSRRKLTDLDVDEYTESETDEYQASGADSEFQPEDEESSDSDYMEEVKPTRRSARIHGGPTQSDEDFVVSGSDLSDSDYRRKSRRRSSKKGSTSKKKKGKPKPKKRRASRKIYDSDSEDSLMDADSGGSSDSEYRPSKKKKRGAASAAKASRKRKVTYKDEASDSEDDEEEPKETKTSKTEKADRPTAAYRGSKRKIIESDSEEEDGEEKQKDESPEEPPSGKRPKRNTRKSLRISSSSSEHGEEPEKEPEVEEPEVEEEEKQIEPPLKTRGKKSLGRTKAAASASPPKKKTRSQAANKKEPEPTPGHSEEVPEPSVPTPIDPALSVTETGIPPPISAQQDLSDPLAGADAQGSPQTVPFRPTPVIHQPIARSAAPGTMGFTSLSHVSTPPHSMSPFRGTPPPGGAMGTPPPGIMPPNYYRPGMHLPPGLIQPDLPQQDRYSLQPMKSMYPVAPHPYAGILSSAAPLPHAQWSGGMTSTMGAAPGLMPYPTTVTAAGMSLPTSQLALPTTTSMGTSGSSEGLSLSDALSHAMQDEY